MVEKKAWELHEDWRRSKERFEYFVVGGTGALCAFIAQTYKAERLALNPATLELVALLTLVGSVFSGFRCLEWMNVMAGLAYESHFAHEEAMTIRAAVAASKDGHVHDIRESITSEEAMRRAVSLIGEGKRFDERAAAIGRKVSFWYRLRNRLLLTGLILLIGARAWRPYLL